MRRLSVYGSIPNNDIQSGTDTKIRKFTFEITNGLPVDTKIDLWRI